MSTSPASRPRSFRWRSAISCSDARSADPPPRGGRIEADFAATAAGTGLSRCAEAGGLRLRRLHGRDCEAVIVNSAGGVVAGDQLTVAITAQEGAAATLGTAAAEKCYRSDGATATIAMHLRVKAGATLHWLPQETILFDGARLHRSLAVELLEDACFLGAETLVFGRLARGEVMREGWLRDSWRLRLSHRLVFADETTIVAPLDVALDRAALGGGARAAALLVAAGRFPAETLDAMRAAMENCTDGVAGGASLRDGVLIARLTSAAPERLRRTLAALIGVMRPALPRSWS